MKQGNENRRGYHKTKVGWIPEEWECVPFTKVFHRATRQVSVKPNEKYRQIGIRSHGKGVFFKDEVTGKALGEKRVFWCQLGALVFNIVFAWEQAVAVLGEETEGMIASHRFPMYRAKNGRASEMFYLRFFSSPRGKHGLILASPGGAGRNKTLGQGELDFLFVPVPPLPEQERIAEVLGAWDRAIGLTDRLIEAKQRLKKGLMQQLLTGRLRFPQFGKPTRKHGELPKGWSEIRLGKCLSQIIGGGTPSKAHPEYWNGNIPWATVKDASRGNTYDTLDHISNVGIRESSASLIPAGTILICTRMAVGKTIRFNCAVAINQDLKALFPKDSLRSDYLLVLLKFHEPQISHLGSGSTVSGIRLEELRNLPILLPDLLEQRHIASCLSACEREIQLLNGRRDRLQEQKKGLMQKLLTGEVRIMERRRG